jgi:hypothetical protein
LTWCAPTIKFPSIPTIYRKRLLLLH